MLCPPYPECVPEGAVNYMDISGCGSGDVNGDGVINVIDIVIVVDLVLSNNYDAIGDVNADGELNILDVVVLIDLVLNGDPNEPGCTDESSWDYDTEGR